MSSLLTTSCLDNDNPHGILFQGIQLYADAIDRDGPGDGDELIESFSIDLEPGRLAPDLNLESVNVSGRFGFASTVLSFQLECQPGESCVEICTTSSTATADATTTSSSSSSSVLAGAVGGSVVFIIIIIIIIAIVVSLVFVFLRQRVIPSFTKGKCTGCLLHVCGHKLIM